MHSETELQPRWRGGGRGEGERENRRTENRDPLVMCRRINLCFPASAEKLLSCNYSYPKIMGVSLLIAPLREKESCC